MSELYKKVRNAFYNELKTDELTVIQKDIYDKIRDYLNTITDKKEKNRLIYYTKELRKLRIYKGFYSNDRNNLTEEELTIIQMVEDINYKGDFKGNNISVSNNKSITLNNYQPKHINSENNITVVRVVNNFPEFTDGKQTYKLEKNDILTLNEKYYKILEKHNIVKRINL